MARALAGRLREPLDGLERGFFLETWVLHELRAAIAIQSVGGQLHYWRTPSGSEVDVIWTRGSRAVGIDVKAAAILFPAKEADGGRQPRFLFPDVRDFGQKGPR